MSENVENPGTEELLKRIVHLETKLGRFADHLFWLYEDCMNHRARQADQYETTFDRLKNVEDFVFPNLQKDIESVYQIIGGDGVPAEPNPLDSRQASPPKPDSV